MASKNKSTRVLELYQLLIDGKTINKREFAKQYGVNERSVQRDIDNIRNYLAEQQAQYGMIRNIEYDKKVNGYRLITQQRSSLAEGEMLAVCKILIESRAFTKDTLNSLIERLLSLCASMETKLQVEQYISNEIFNYAEPVHAPLNTELIWTIAKAIKEQRIIEITYVKLKEEEQVNRKIEPVGILYSEFYFYLMGVIKDTETRKHFAKKDDSYPTIYRLDRIVKLEFTSQHFSTPYRTRFQEGAYKNRVQYMYGGELQHIKFKFSGRSIEAVLDKLPMAKITQQEQQVAGSTQKNVYTVEAEVFGSGILMWLLSQGSNIEVLKPQTLRDQWLKEAQAIVDKAP